MLSLLVLLSLVLAAIPAGMFVVNLACYQRPGPARRLRPALPRLSVLIPARNEEGSIGAAVQSVLHHQDPHLEVIVLDDHSEDRTASIVKELAARDARVRLLPGPALPAGWCGKQFACQSLAAAAGHPVLLFMDADVRLEPGALDQLRGMMEDRRADLLSGIPRQQTGSLLEKLLLPLIHFILLGFLPMPAMRRNRHPKYAAGCGQLMMVRRQAYFRAGGHAAIRASLHDGLKLPRAFREAGCKTDLVDATGLARCRMYRGGRETWSGLGKNATEGLAAPGILIPMSLLLLGGQVMPFLLLACWSWLPETIRPLAWAAVGCAWTPRWLALVRFRQPWLGALLHPVAILLLLALQWQAAWRRWRGVGTAWKGRAYTEPDLPSGTGKAPRPASRMPWARQSLAGLGLATVLVGVPSHQAADPAPPPPPDSPGQTNLWRDTAFLLRDQFDVAHHFRLPKDRPLLLLAADRQGAEQIDGWLDPLLKAYPESSRPFLLAGVADMRGVPKPLRSWVRRKFKQARRHPVMLDWTGELVGHLELKEERANVFLIQPSGDTVYQEAGPVTEDRLSSLRRALQTTR